MISPHPYLYSQQAIRPSVKTFMCYKHYRYDTPLRYKKIFHTFTDSELHWVELEKSTHVHIFFMFGLGFVLGVLKKKKREGYLRWF